MMRLLDFFCCEGGASVGYQRAGFTVYGIDRFRVKDEKGKWQGFARERYPFPAWQGDALDAMAVLLAGGRLPFTGPAGTGPGVEYLGLDDFDAVTGSPPCQAYSVTRHTHSNEHPQLVEPFRAFCEASGLPWIMENVVGAPLVNPLVLCGTMFGLHGQDADGRNIYLRRHRLFEAGGGLWLWGPGTDCRCLDYRRAGWDCGGVYGGGSRDKRHAKDVRRGGYNPPHAVAQQLLGIGWMTWRGMCQSIPPAYTEFLGGQLLAAVRAPAGVAV